MHAGSGALELQLSPLQADDHLMRLREDICANIQPFHLGIADARLQKDGPNPG
jgi:hypothetical protein